MDLLQGVDKFVDMIKPDDIARLAVSTIIPTGKSEKYNEILLKIFCRLLCHNNNIPVENAGFIEMKLKAKIDILVKELKVIDINP